MTTEYGKNKPSGQDIRQERFDELLDVDARILRLLAQRSRLLGKEASWRKAKGKARIDAALEKALWAEWEQAGRQDDLPPRLLRQLFNHLNLFGQEDAKGRRRPDAYMLAPHREPVSVRMAAPRCLQRTRLWMVLAAASGRALELESIILNDPFIELVKSLNQAGGRASWIGDDQAELQAGTGLEFEERLIYAGEDPLNFHLLLGMALAGAGRMKFSGGPGLKLLDLSTVNAVLPRLGARLVPLNPHGDGLPARLECGGEMAAQIRLPEGASPELAMGLALAAWAYPQGLSLDASSCPSLVPALEMVAEVLADAGIQAALEGAVCRVQPGTPVFPSTPDLPPDPVLSSYLLALPLFADGKVSLSGFTPDQAEQTGVQALARFGADLQYESGELTSAALKLPDSDIELGPDPALMPLGVALALRSRRELFVPVPADADLDAAVQFLDHLNASYSVQEDGLRIAPAALRWEGSWASPSPYFCLAAALTSFLRPGIAIENPGMLTALWPQFWNLFNTLPSGRMKPKAPEPEHDEPKRRRIKIGK
ncbi:MAG: chorismate mutase [Desulfovibrio sp.]|jgi:5-enolpyruvylshikimate-3-phosphate synthase/chorismate mutase|nr:chorismate mutase [Desulfovibrio sp.]